MLVACYYFEWKPFGIFIYSLIEIVVLVIIYALLRLKDEKQNPHRYRKSQSIINLFIGLIPMVVFQYFIIGFASVSINPEEDFIEQNLLLSEEVLYVFLAVTVLYVIKVLQISKQQERIRVFQENFLFQVLALSGANTIGFITIIVFDVNSLLPVLTLMVVFRVFLELYFVRRIKAH
jgi:hypothetical protein